MNLPNKYKRFTASDLVKTGSGVLESFYVSSTTAGTIQFWDNTSGASVPITGVITPAVGFHDMGHVAFTTGLYATVTGTMDVTVHYE